MLGGLRKIKQRVLSSIGDDLRPTPDSRVLKGDGQGRAPAVNVSAHRYGDDTASFVLEVERAPQPGAGTHWALRFDVGDIAAKQGQIFAFCCRLRASKPIQFGNAKISVIAGGAIAERGIAALSPDECAVTMVHYCPPDAKEIFAAFYLGEGTGFTLDAPCTIFIDDVSFENVAADDERFFDAAGLAQNKAELEHAHYVIAKRMNFQNELDRITRSEPECGFIPRLADRARSSLDIGASLGYFSVLLSDVSKDVWAFEANPELFSFLQFNTQHKNNIRCFSTGISNQATIADLHVPYPNGDPLAACGGGNIASEAMAIADVTQKKLQAVLIDLNNVDVDPGFVKIDVEGHERQVLAGMERILAKSRPNILIEIEYRHDSKCADTFRIFKDANYNGYYFDRQAGTMKSLSSFDLDKHQISLLSSNKEVTNISNYIYNFIFCPAERDVLG